MTQKNRSDKNLSKSIYALDLFCGAGGLTRGLKNAGIKVLAGYDIDKNCEYPYTANQRSKYYNIPVQNLTSDQLKSEFPSDGFKLLAGCAPCQPFSKYTQGRDNSKDSKWSLLNSFATLATELKPDVITMENVPELERHQIFWDFTDKLEDAGYHVTYYKVYCPEYGIPQTRKRLVLFASKYKKIDLIKPTHKKPENYLTVRDAIFDLPYIEAGRTCEEDIMHRSSSLTKKNLLRIKSSKPGGTWRDWPENLVAECHKNKSGKGYSSVYGRMEWDAPSPTITTSGASRMASRIAFL